jgi:DNA-binding NarL/FixJ family response regulator
VGAGAGGLAPGDLDRATGLQQESLRLREIVYDPAGTALNVEPLALIAASGREYGRAAVLLGAAAGLWRSAGVTPADFRPMAEHQRNCERQARQAPGEQAFRAAYDRGLELPAAVAVTYALQQRQPPKMPPARLPENSRAPAMPGGGLLTPRELQVARLVAGGRSNKQIAAELVISQRTAEGHVERIVAKLGFTSRARGRLGRRVTTGR